MTDPHRLAEIFKALANPTRLSLVAELAAARAGAPLGVTELARRVEISRFAASFHLEQLREAGLVGKQRRGTRWVHSLAEDTIDEIDVWLYDVLPPALEAERLG